MGAGSRVSFLLEQVRGEVRRRSETDRRLDSYAWIIMRVIGALAAISFIALSVTRPLGLPAGAWLLLLVTVAVYLAQLVLLYMLISRRNKHFARQLRLFEYAAQLLKEASRARGIDAEARLASIERELREARDEEGERNAVLWVILTLLIGLAGLYVYYFLMRDFRKHETREDRMLEDMGAVMYKIGAILPYRREEKIPSRSFTLYLLLSIITLGLFEIYWVYALIRDPNVHFREQGRIEDELLSRMEQVAQGL